MEARTFFTVYMVAMTIGICACLYASTYMRESLSLDYCEFADHLFATGGTNKGIDFTVGNTGRTSAVFVENVLVNNAWIYPKPGGTFTIDAGKTRQISILYNWSYGEEYTIALVTPRGGIFSFTATARPVETLWEIDDVIWNTVDNTTSMVVKSTSEYTRKIVGLQVLKGGGLVREVTVFTDIGTGKLLYSNQTVTIVLHWPNQIARHWTNGEEYSFCVVPEFGISKQFNSTAPL